MQEFLIMGFIGIRTFVTVSTYKSSTQKWTEINLVNAATTHLFLLPVAIDKNTTMRKEQYRI